MRATRPRVHLGAAPTIDIAVLDGPFFRHTRGGCSAQSDPSPRRSIAGTGADGDGRSSNLAEINAARSALSVFVVGGSVPPLPSWSD